VVSKSPVGATCRPVRLLIAAVGPPERFVCGVVVVEVSLPHTNAAERVVGRGGPRVRLHASQRYFASGTDSPLSTASLQPQLERAGAESRAPCATRTA
jgi:hypothetical protein